MNGFDKKRFKTALLFAAAVILIYAVIMNIGRLGGLITRIGDVFAPIIAGTVMALILGTPMAFFERFLNFLNAKSKFKKKLPEKAVHFISMILTYILAGMALSFVIIVLIPALTDSVNEIARAVERAYPKVLAFLEKQDIRTDDIKAIVDSLDIRSILSTVTSNAGAIVGTLMSSVSGIFSGIINAVTAVIFSVYLLANKKILRRQFNKLLDAYGSERTAPKIKYVVDLVITTFSKFFSGQFLEAIILGVIFFIAMSIFGFPYAPVISMIIGITAFIPYVGAFIGCAIGVLLILFQSPMKALLFIVMFLIIQQLENNLIYPRVVGTSVGLPAIWTFTALIVGGAMYGVVGMLIFIPLASILFTLVKNDVASRLKIRAEEKENNEKSGDGEG